jgi:2,4-dienoyl-CoA reductase-like NADH-dependent reductase (Old Yellow Enzyme family)
MTDAVHAAGGKIVAQLAHSGHFAPKSLTGAPPQVVSDVEGLTRQPCRVLTTEDIQILITAYARAAYRARTAGFDGIQLHSAHGYLLSQFLSPAYNQRRDDYGGSVENRCRIHVEILKAIRSKVGADFPVLIKINSEDCIENGLTLVDSLEAAGRMVDAGLDGIELSGGTLTSGKLSPSRMGINKVEKEAYFKNAAEAFKKTIHVPLILVGGMRSPSVAEQTVSTGTADYISLSRPFIREPGLINRWKSGDTRPAFCTSDNLCFAPAMEGKGVQCITEQLEKKKQS